MSKPTTETPSEIIARRIRAARKAKGLTQDQVRDIAGISQGAISLWERARSMENLDAMARALTACGIDPGILTGPESENTVEESDLLALFRRLSPEARAIVLDLARLQSNRRIN